MTFDVTVEHTAQGEYVARCADPEAVGRAADRDAALENLRGEIRFRWEMCPCTGVKDDFVELRVVGTR